MAIRLAFGLRCGATHAGFEANPRAPFNSLMSGGLPSAHPNCPVGPIGGCPVSGCRRSRLLLNLAELPPGAGGTHPTGSLFSIPCHETNRRSRTLLTNPSIINTDNMLDPP